MYLMLESVEQVKIKIGVNYKLLVVFKLIFIKKIS
jgi:hypothetical protein